LACADGVHWLWFIHLEVLGRCGSARLSDGDLLFDLIEDHPLDQLLPLILLFFLFAHVDHNCYYGMNYI